MKTYYTVCYGTKSKRDYSLVKSEAFKYKKDFASALKCRGLRFHYVWTAEELLRFAGHDLDSREVDLKTYLEKMGL